VNVLDGYEDESSCFGVLPYISPYTRQDAGVIKHIEYGF